MEGELLLAKDDVLWLPPPTTAPPPHDSGRPIVAVRNRHLRQIVCGVLDRPDGLSGAAGLRDFLQLIDESFWTIAPEGPWADEALPVLMGRPLAVLRARLGAMTADAPAIRQSWEDSARRVTDGFEKVRFAVQLGSTELLDDGLVGYYLDDDYRQIQSVFARGPGPPGRTSATSAPSCPSSQRAPPC